MHLPSPVHTYFTAQSPEERDAISAAFAHEAVVHDEGHSYRGSQEISEWWVAAKTKYRHQAQPMETTKSGGKTVVRAIVTGEFPGSPAVLTFTFGLDGDRITDLEIG